MKLQFSDGHIFSTLLEAKNMRIQDVAELTGLPIQTLYGIKKRANNTTTKKIIDKILEAMELPPEAWDGGFAENELIKNVFGEKEEIQKDYTVNPVISKIALEQRNMSAEYMKYALKIIGISEEYTIDEITEILYNEKTIDGTLANHISYIFHHGPQLVDMSELKFLDRMRRLSKDAKEELQTAFDTICFADHYRNIELKKQIDKMFENKESTDPK